MPAQISKRGGIPVALNIEDGRLQMLFPQDDGTVTGLEMPYEDADEE